MEYKSNEVLSGVIQFGFRPDDVIDASALVAEVTSSDKPLNKLIRDGLTSAGLILTPDYAASDPEKYKGAVVEELNRIIAGELVYTEERFAGVKLSVGTRKLVRTTPEGVDMVRANKLLILEAFPKYFRRKPGRGKNLIQQPASVYKLGNGKFAVCVNLVEPKEIEGKLRSGRQKFERQTETDANNLCADINNVIFGKEMARQLNKQESDFAKHFLWELIEPKHPEWMKYPKEMFEHLEKTGFRVETEESVPTVLEAAKLFWAEHVRYLEKETQLNFRNSLAFILPVYCGFKTFHFTDALVLKMAYGSDRLNFWATSWKKKETPEQAEKRLWDKPTVSKSKRPWTHANKVRFLSCIRSFKSWMHESLDPETQRPRNWCPEPNLPVPNPPKVTPGRDGDDESSDIVMDILAAKNPALTVPQAQALLDVSHIAFDGAYAAFYVHGLFSGSRVKETKRMGTGAYDSEDGVQIIPTQANKKDESRESTLSPNLMVAVEALKAAGLYSKKNLRPNGNQRAVIHVLAGFTTNAKQVLVRVARERKRLAKLGIELPKYSWGTPYPKNALRRTSLSMHYKLFGKEALTKEWAGNGDVFRPYYKRLVTKAQAREFWVMLPTHLKEAGITVQLPPGHQLESAMTPEISQAAMAAGEATKSVVAKMAEAKAKAEAARPAELKARQAVYNKRAYEKRKAKKRAAEQRDQASDSSAGTSRENAA